MFRKLSASIGLKTHIKDKLFIYQLPTDDESREHTITQRNQLLII